MPFVENLGARIFWDEQGSGAPLLLITGLGWSSSAWHRSRPILSQRYRTIDVDNRGAGQSEAPPGPYSIVQMAADAVAVLNAARVNTAHVFGFAMGGMIAQELALQYPKKVRSLILGATSAGGQDAVRPDPEVLKVLTSRDSDRDQFAAALNPFIYDRATSLQRIQQDGDMRRKWFPSAEPYFAQLHAVTDWEALSRIVQIKVPTLVLHGENDRMFPVENAKLIAARIPGAKLVVLPHAGHVFTTDQPDAAHAAILEFLGAQATRQSERATPVLES
jgi:pimeloyl-ACP methyl ester carboxylesterase